MNDALPGMLRQGTVLYKSSRERNSRLLRAYAWYCCIRQTMAEI